MTLPARVYFVGGGPGAPDLLTIRARRILDAAKTIIFTGSLLERSLFEGSSAEIFDSAGMHLDELVETMATRVARGEAVARLHSGDPSIFGAIHEQMARLRALGVPFEIVPGVSSAFAAAASVCAELTVPELAQSVILTRIEGRTPMPEGQRLTDLAQHRTTMCLYLSVALIHKAVRELSTAYPPETPVVVVAGASTPQERIVRGTLADIAPAVRAAGIGAQAMILVGPALDPTLLSHPGEHASKLYDAAFTHKFRRAAIP